MTTNTKLEERASTIVNEFLSILEPWFQPDDKWDRIEKTANEFLFEGAKRELAQERAQVVKEAREALEKLRKDIPKTLEEVEGDDIAEKADKGFRMKGFNDGLDAALDALSRIGQEE